MLWVCVAVEPGVNVANLLVISRFSDQHFLNADYTFVHHQLAHLRKHFDQVYVLAPAPRIPRPLKPWRRWSETIRLRLAKEDYAYENVRVFFARYGILESRFQSGAPLASVLADMQRIIDENDLHFDLIHAHMATHAWYGAELGRRRGVPVVTTIHDDHDGLLRLLDSPGSRAASALVACDALIRVTPTDIPEIARRIGSESNIAYIPNGFDASHVPCESVGRLRSRLDLPGDRPLLIAVARWVDRKDPLILLEALAKLRERGHRPLPTLCLLGEDRTSGRIQRARARLGLERDVCIRGRQEPDDVLRYMRAATAVVLYSRSEGNPTVMFEALGCGRPFIGSAVGGVPVVLEDPRLGAFGPPGDVDSLVRLMEQALTTRWDEDYIRAEAARYTWESVAEQIQRDVLLPTLAGRSAP